MEWQLYLLYKDAIISGGCLPSVWFPLALRNSPLIMCAFWRVHYLAMQKSCSSWDGVVENALALRNGFMSSLWVSVCWNEEKRFWSRWQMSFTPVIIVHYSWNRFLNPGIFLRIFNNTISSLWASVMAWWADYIDWRTLSPDLIILGHHHRIG